MHIKEYPPEIHEALNQVVKQRFGLSIEPRAYISSQEVREKTGESVSGEDVLGVYQSLKGEGKIEGIGQIGRVQQMLHQTILEMHQVGSELPEVVYSFDQAEGK